MSGLVASHINIDELTNGEVFNLAGHDRGLAARQRFDLDRMDNNAEVVFIHFPQGFRQVSSSFFQGMFSASVQRFGNLDAFFDHYVFDAPTHIRSKLIDYAEQVLNRRDY
jgi:hypothetical protein